MNIFNGIKQFFYTNVTIKTESKIKSDLKVHLIELNKQGDFLVDLQKASLILAVSGLALFIFKGFLVSLVVAPLLVVSITLMAATLLTSYEQLRRVTQLASSLYRTEGSAALTSVQEDLEKLGFSKKKLGPFFFVLHQKVQSFQDNF